MSPHFLHDVLFTPMKHETVEQIKTVVPAVVGVGTTWGFHEVSQGVSIAVGLVTIAYVLVQFFFLLRKWHLLEKNGWDRPSRKE